MSTHTANQDSQELESVSTRSLLSSSSQDDNSDRWIDQFDPMATITTPVFQGKKTSSQSSTLATRSTSHSVQVLEREEDNHDVPVDEHQDQRFFVRTTYTSEQQPQQLRFTTSNVPLFFVSMLDQIRWLSAERQHIIETETRVLPRIDSNNTPQPKAFSVPAWLETFVVAVGMIASLLVHAINIFNFPSYQEDEGTYMANAWAAVHGMLQPYAYRYDHPPIGWMQIALWVQATGGFFTFNNAVNSGRVLMLLYVLGSSLLVYLIARRLSGNRIIASIALLIFSLSPLSILYQRQVLLDNIGTFWLLLALYLLVASNSRLLYIVPSAVSFGMAILSKEIFLIFMPVMLYTVWLNTTTFQRKFGMVVFTYIVISLSSVFLLLAVLKGELFPPGVLPWDHHPHLSLIGTLFTQVQRGQQQGSLISSWQTWLEIDPLLIIVSSIAIVINLIGGWKHRQQRLLALYAVSFMVLLARGGIVFPYYIIPLLPFMALNIVVAGQTVFSWIGNYRNVKKERSFIIASAILAVIFIGAIIPYNVLYTAPMYTLHPASTQEDALLWIRENVPHNDVLIINNYLYTDLHEEGGAGVANGATYPYAHFYLNAAYDPSLHDGLLQNNWKNIDYIVVDQDMLNSIKTLGGPMLLMDRALHHAILRKEFRANSYGGQAQEIIQIYQVIHTS